MSNEINPNTDPQPMIYQIRIKGHLGNQWSEWFDGLIIKLEDNGETLLIGPVIDQAGLHGLLKKVRDLGLPLISVSPLDIRKEDSSEIKPSDDITCNKSKTFKEGKNEHKR
jgi:hypothetical protein